MGELNVKDFLILADQKPGEVTFSNFNELKSYLKNGLSVYSATTYTAENLEDAINDRNQLKAIKKKLTDKKKEIEKAYTMPYEDVKRMLDELIDMVKEPLNRAGEIIKECERQKKRNEIISFAKKEVAILGEDAVTVLKSPAFYNSRWLNATYKIRDIEREIIDKVAEIKNALELIRSLGGDNAAVLSARYFETLSTAGMSEFLQSIKQEEAKGIAVEKKNVSNISAETKMNDFMTNVLPTRDEIQQDGQEIVSKLFILKGTEKNISDAIIQVQMFGVDVEEIKSEDNKFETTTHIDKDVNINFETDYESHTQKVVVGDSVTICNISTGAIETFTIKETYYTSIPTGFSHGYNRDIIYSTEEKSDNDISKNEIRSESPLAKAMLGKSVGHIFWWMNKEGERDKYQIMVIKHS